MKKLIIVLMVLASFISEAQNNWLLDKVITDMRAYKAQFIPDGGSMRHAEIVDGYYAMCEENEMADSIRFCFLGEAAIKDSTSGIYKFVKKVYDLGDFANHGTQITPASMPYLSGNIASDSRYCLLNPTGGTRTITIPTLTVSGTYTITKVYNNDSIGKTVVSHTDLTSGTLNSISFTGRMYAYIIRSIQLTTAQKAAEKTFLESVYPEIESVTIGSGVTAQTWELNNHMAIVTPMGNVIQNMTAAANVGKVTVPLDFTTGWNATCTIVDANTITIGSPNWVRFPFTATIGKWYKYHIAGVASAGSYRIYDYSLVTQIYDGITGTFDITFYYKAITNFGGILFRGIGATGTVDFSAISVEEVGWAGSQGLYDGIYAQTSGTAAQKTTAALRASAMWQSPNNDIPSQSVYGKIFNKFAAALIAEDIAAYNTANNPDWGYNIPTRAQLTTLSAIGGNAAKKEGTNYWTTANGTNFKGLSVLGSGYNNSSGAYTGSKTSAYILCRDADFIREIKDGDNTFDEVAITVEGGSIRLIKD